MNRQAGSGTVQAALFAQFGHPGWGTTDAGVQQDPTLIGAQNISYAASVLTLTGGAEILTGAGQVAELLMRPIRLPRNPGTTMLGFSTDASALADYACVLSIGLFPQGMGQDGSG